MMAGKVQCPPNLVRKLSLLATGLIVIAVPVAMGQTNSSVASVRPQAKDISATPAEFEVASIRQNTSLGGRSHIISSSHGARITTINVTLMSILQFGFNIPQTRILDAPGWLSSEKFDIEAKADSLDDELMMLTSEEGKLEKQRMVQALLADRFQLNIHHETRELPVYALVVEKNSSKLQASKANGCTINSSRSHIEILGCDSMAVLAEGLAEDLGRVVIDKTALAGRYDINLKWAPDDGPPSITSGSAGTSSSVDSSGPSIYTALQKQPGLKLEPQKGPVQVLFVDHVEQPSAN